MIPSLARHDHDAAIAALGLFAGLPADALDEVVAHARIRVLPRGGRVFDQGATVERAHALLAGAIRIAQTGRDGGQVMIRFIGPGEIFGSVAIFTDHLYPADGIAMTESIEVSWEQAELRHLVERYPRIAVNLLAIAGGRLAELQNRVRELATQRAERRIANTLLRLARQAGRTAGAGVAIDLPLRRKDIADIAGTTLYTVSRTLNDWRRRGLIVIEGHGLLLPSIARLERITDD